MKIISAELRECELVEASKCSGLHGVDIRIAMDPFLMYAVAIFDCTMY